MDGLANFKPSNKHILSYWLRVLSLTQQTPLDLVNMILEYLKYVVIFDVLDKNPKSWKSDINYQTSLQSLIIKPKCVPSVESTFMCSIPFKVTLSSHNPDEGKY